VTFAKNSEKNGALRRLKQDLARGKNGYENCAIARADADAEVEKQPNTIRAVSPRRAVGCLRGGRPVPEPVDSPGSLLEAMLTKTSPRSRR
jgi:hypothetical protein